MCLGGRLPVEDEDAPMKIILLRDGDKCSVNAQLRDARNDYTVRELEIEYFRWLDQIE
jgi:hypothetical protein